MSYKVVITINAQEDMDSIVEYMINCLCNTQAARNFLDSLNHTLDLLKSNAESYKLCSNKKLSALGYRQLNLIKTRYFLLYRVEQDIVFIDGVFHEVQDIENKIR